MRCLSHILGPLLFLAYIVLWMGGVFVAVCADYPPIVRWGAVVAVATPPFFAWWLFRRIHLPEGWYRPSRILVILVAVSCFLATWPTLLAGGVGHRVNVIHCALRGQQVAYAIMCRPVRYSPNKDTNETPPPFWPETNVWRNSNGYFAELLRIDASYPKPWLTSEDLMHSTGLKPASSPEALENGGGCAWACLAGIGDCDSDDTPFLWTDNLRIGPEDFRGADPAHPKRWGNRVDRRLIHGLGPWVVVIRKNGSMSRAPAYAVTDNWFLGSSSNAADHIEVLYPKR